MPNTSTKMQLDVNTDIYPVKEGVTVKVALISSGDGKAASYVALKDHQVLKLLKNNF